MSNSTIKRYNGSSWDTLEPITTGQNVYGSGTQAATPLLDSSNNINSAFLSNYVDKNYIASRGENLLTNGTALLGNNYNFSALTYDGSDTYYAGGCFKHVGGRIEPKTDEYMPVDVSQTYEISYWAKSSSSTSTLYDYLAMYDIDKLEVSARNIMWISGSTTTLAQDLKNGDTKVYLTSVAGFNKTTSASYQRGLIFWNYTNSFGYTYGTETYSRNVYTNLWANSSSFDTTNNYITLSSAWNKGPIPAGTSVSQSSDGSTYTYMTTGAAGSTNWFNRKATMSGVGKNNASGKFREGTAFVRLGWLIDQNSESNVTWKLSTLSVAKFIPTTYVSTVNGSSGAITNVAKTNADNSFSTAQTFKDITLYSASGDSPRLAFQRGTLTDTYNDWSLYDSSGYLYIQQRGNGSTAWETRATFTQSGVSFAGNISENGTELSSKYYLASNPNGYTTNTGTVIGSSLTADYFTLGNGTVNIKISSYKPANSLSSWSTTSDVYLPTMKAISNYVSGSYVSTSSANYIKTASVSGNTLTLTKGNNTTVTFTPSGGGSVSNIAYQTGYVSLEDYVYFTKGGSGKIIISGEQGIYSGWNFNLECNATYCVGGCVYAEMIISDNDVVCINWCGDDGTWYNDIYTSHWDSLDTWRVGTFIGYGTLNITYIGNITAL